MGMRCPDWAQKLFLITTGDGWPEADEDLLRTLAHEWVGIAGTVYELTDRITEPVRAIRRTDWIGPEAEAFTAEADSVLRQGAQQWSGLAAGSRELADFIHETGANIQYMK